jgi:hypothetical protein
LNVDFLDDRVQRSASGSGRFSSFPFHTKGFLPLWFWFLARAEGLCGAISWGCYPGHELAARKYSVKTLGLSA